MHLSVLVHEILEKKKKRKKKRTLIHNITLSLVSIHHNIRNTELLATLKLDLRMPGLKRNHVTTVRLIATKEGYLHENYRNTGIRGPHLQGKGLQL